MPPGRGWPWNPGNTLQWRGSKYNSRDMTSNGKVNCAWQSLESERQFVSFDTLCCNMSVALTHSHTCMHARTCRCLMGSCRFPKGCCEGEACACKNLLGHPLRFQHCGNFDQLRLHCYLPVCPDLRFPDQRPPPSPPAPPCPGPAASHRK